MVTFLVAVAILTAALSDASMGGDDLLGDGPGLSVTHPCAKYPNCTACVASPLCGWCSEPVIYPGNITGAQCAGFNPSGPNPFECDGIYSTETCGAGYVCNMVNFTCDLSKPGAGTTKPKCEAECVNKGQIFLCNHTTSKCYEVPPGTSGGGSMATCQASCAHPSPHPAPPPPPPPPTQLFACNHTTGQCVNASAGKGTSKEVCQEQCKKILPTEDYICNTKEHKCDKLPPGVPGGESLKTCEEQCLPHPQPGPPPALLNHMFRGIQIQSDYVIGEFDMKVTESLVTFVDVRSAAKSWKGLPFHIQNSVVNEMWVKLSSGKYVKTISATGDPGPQTTFIATAIAAAGAVTPSSIKAAMTSGDQQVYSFAACQTPQCNFTLASSRKYFGARHLLRARKAHAHLGLLSHLDTDNLFSVTDGGRRDGGDMVTPRDDDPATPYAAEDAVGKVNPDDACSKFDQSCAQCLASGYCGWCSVNVTYLNSTGTQCAGFNGPSGSSVPFRCNGHYSTFNCTAGYKCDETNFQCVVTTPGNGFPKEVCEQLCRPTPAPTPSPPQAVCNLTTKQCHPCPDNETSCTGSLPLPACESGCSHHKKGPPASLIGMWRGLYIQVGYKRIEVDIVLNSTAGAVYHSETLMYTATIDTIGSDAMLWSIQDGQYKGFKYGTKYQVSTEPGGFYSAITMASGKLNGGMPQNFDAPMVTAGEREYVFVKCTADPCKFRKP